MKNLAGEKVSVGRAKTEFQRKRNGTLRKVKEILKKDTRSKDLPVVLEFDLAKDKSRSVKVGGNIAFQQMSSDMTGTFLALFTDVTL